MSKQSHGSAESYFIGFMLSFVFTAIPYYLVTHKTFNSNTLLAVILGFAVLQMLIQIFFFLHLGRGPKPLYNVVFFVSTAGLIVVVVGASIFIMNHLHYNMSPAETSKQLSEGEAIYQVGGQLTGACQEIGKNHQVAVSSGALSLTRTVVQHCDTLSFTSQDGGTHTVVFAKTYAGQTELTVRKGHSETITLNEAGTYQFYIKSDSKIVGTFTVTQ